MKKLLLALVSTLSLLTACTKNNDLQVDDDKFGQVKIKFDHIVNGKKLVLNDYTYSNTSDETYTISMLKYFVTNIKFTKSNGEIYLLPKNESYFLLDVSSEMTLFPTFNIPTGEYAALEFYLGVDSLTNTLPVEQRTGVLNSSTNGMYWEWNSGYIHLKIEGNSPQAENPNKAFKYHIGFFGGYSTPTVNNTRKIKIDLTKAGISKVQENLSSDIHLMVDLGKIFDGKNKISIKTNPIVMHAGPHAMIADNYATMFTHDHTHNFQKIVKNDK